LVTKTLVSEDLIEEFKENMKITHDDNKIKGSLVRAIAFVRSRCGDFELNDETDADILAKGLVFNHARYDYYESTDLFEDNYLSDITHLALLLAGEENDK